MALKQKLADVQKEAAENEKSMQHYRVAHDKLRLEEIE